MPTIEIPARFNGPPGSGQGGYSCGVLAGHTAGPAAVSLRRPVPLGRPLEVRRRDEDAAALALAGEELIAEAVPWEPLATWDGPAVTIEEARAARERFAAPADGEFDRCFVCGRARDDGFHVFTGPVGTDGAVTPEDPVAGGGLVASTWTPPDWAADDDGAVRAEHVWATLDCPGYFALHGTDLTVAYLVRQQTEILAAPRAGVECVVVGRPLERAGRKGLAATAILAADGAVLAHAETLLVAPRKG